MNASHSPDTSCPNTVRAADGQVFPISARADSSAGTDLTDNGVMSTIVFTMRSEPGRVSC